MKHKRLNHAQLIYSGCVALVLLTLLPPPWSPLDIAGQAFLWGTATGVSSLHHHTTVGACPSLAAPDERVVTIPKILHHIYIGERLPDDIQPWVETCLLHYSRYAGWTHRFWDEKAAMDLITVHDPEFLPYFRLYPPWSKSDVLRYYIMKHIGGLYLDNDNECWREGSDTLAGYDVVLQGQTSFAGAANGMMASIPHHPFWDEAIQIVKERQGWKGGRGALYTTGPKIVRDSYISLFNITLGTDGLLPDYSQHEGSCIRVYQKGSWYLPCHYAETDCAERLQLQRAVGRADTINIIGMHRYQSTWHPGASKAFPDSVEAFRDSVCNTTSLQPEAAADVAVA